MISALGIFSGCASTGNSNQTANPWVGASSDQLFRAWGLPDQQVQISNDRRKIQYIKRYIFSAPPTARYLPDPFYRYCITQFELDERNIVVGVEQDGRFCKS